jgi:hypothetical protein
MKKTLLFLLVLSLAFAVASPPVVEGKSLTASNQLAISAIPSSSITRGGNFSVTVQVKNPGMQSVYCLKVDLKFSGAFSRNASQSQSASSLYSGQSRSITFWGKAPDTAGASGTATASVRWYQTSRCNTTPMQVTTSAVLKVGPSGTITLPPWKLSVNVFPKKAVEDAVPVTFSVKDSAGRQVAYKLVPPDHIPYSASIELPRTAGWYTVSVTLAYVIPTRYGEMTKVSAAIRSVYVYRDGQSIDMYP